MSRPLFFAPLAAAVLSACTADPSGAAREVRYQADRAAYTSADAITTVLLNQSGSDVGYNLCVATLEKRESGGWVRVARNPEHPCALPMFTLHPGESATFSEPASHVPGDGTYRLRTRIEAPIAGRALDVATNAFDVRAPRAN